MIRLLALCLILLKVSDSQDLPWVGADGALCPDCSKIKCSEQLEDSDCPAGTILTQNVLFGCCPACVKYLKYGDPCPGIYTIMEGPVFMKWKEFSSTNGDSTDTKWTWVYYPNEFISATEELPCSTIEVYADISGKSQVLPERIFSSSFQKSPRDENKTVPVINSARCSPHLSCNLIYDEYEMFETPVCRGPKKEDFYTPMEFEDMPCIFREADYRGYVKADDCSIRYWKPKCLFDTGVFAPVQLKSYDSNYWCSTPTGTKIFGGDRTTIFDTEINCKCSRKIWELKQSKTIVTPDQKVIKIPERTDVSLHCEKTGNYEELQCDREVCWCINPETGLPVSKVVPESLWDILPCYDRMDFEERIGAKYQRKCESRSLGIQKTAEILKNRGSNWVVDNVLCDERGGFFRTMCEDESRTCYCVSSEMTKSSYFFQSGTFDGAACRCARDYLDGLSFTSNCDGHGNYKDFMTLSTQSNPSTVEFCTDTEDGWRVSGQVPDLDNKHNENPLPCCIDSSLIKQTWPASPEAFRPMFSCRKYVGEGACDKSPFCLDALKSCDILA